MALIKDVRTTIWEWVGPVAPMPPHFCTTASDLVADVNGYLPTHLSERSHPQGPDPVWNDEHCRNKRILIDDTTRMALASEKPATLATYRMELGDKFIPVKNIFVPLWIKGRRWGNYELAYRDD